MCDRSFLSRWLSACASSQLGGSRRELTRGRGGRTRAGAARLVFCAALLAVFLGVALRASADSSSTNVTVVNVTPTSFSLLWRFDNSTPSVAVFADAAGQTNLAGQIGIEAFPVHTGDPTATDAYTRRQSRLALQAKTQRLGQNLVQISGCKPGTTYYYQVTSTVSGAAPVVYPDSGPLPSVTTETENSFVMDAQQLILNVPGADVLGSVVLLTHTNAAHPLAGVVGDGVNTNQVFFNVCDLFALSSEGGNFAPVGIQTFTVDMIGTAPGQADALAQFTLTFSTNFVTGSGNSIGLESEFLAVTLGSTVMQTGQTNQVAVNINSGVNLASLDLTVGVSPDHLTNFVLGFLAPEVDPAGVTVAGEAGGGMVLHLPARPGQFLFGNKAVAQLTFTALAGRSSVFVPLALRQINARKGDGSLLAANLFGSSGRVVVVGREALLEAGLQPGGARAMTLYGNPYSCYALEYATNLSNPVLWTRLNPLPVTQLATLVTGLAGAPQRIYYRAVEVFADPPILQASVQPDRTRSLRIYGQPSRQYTLEYATNLSNVLVWYPLLTATLTNSSESMTVGETNPVVFYRLHRN